jgi:hypothetical protein
MPHHYDTPQPVGNEASRKSLDGCFRDCLTPLAMQSQFLIAAYRIRPELAVMMAAAVFGGAHHG